MPINCPEGEKPRYRVKTTSKSHEKIRLAFCGNKVVEHKKLAKKAKSKKILGKY